jgi:hypothetical protein
MPAIKATGYISIQCPPPPAPFSLASELREKINDLLDREGGCSAYNSGLSESGPPGWSLEIELKRAKALPEWLPRITAFLFETGIPAGTRIGYRERRGPVRVSPQQPEATAKDREKLNFGDGAEARVDLFIDILGRVDGLSSLGNIIQGILSGRGHLDYAEQRSINAAMNAAIHRISDAEACILEISKHLRDSGVGERSTIEIYSEVVSPQVPLMG